MSSTADLPSVAEIVGRVLRRVPPEQQPLLIAVAERLAAERYRGWANDPANASHRSRLLACAAREEEIAHRVEALYPDANATQRTILATNPDLEETNRSLFAGRPLDQQFTIQAQGERLGAATWRAFSGGAANAETRDTFLACATLEEESAEVLESIIGGRS